MNKLKLVLLISLLTPFISFGKPAGKRLSSGKPRATEWILSELLQTGKNEIRIVGKPEIIVCKYGKALQFNGSSDGIFLDQMPLAKLEKFTIEIVLRPFSGGNFEQRYFHCGEVRGGRVLLELRSVKSGWYLDAFVKSGDQQKTLIDSTLLHPLDQWAHIAFVVDNNNQSTYVNGIKELEGQIKIEPLKGGKTSIGVRQNEKSWFKGAIYKIRISPEALYPNQFLKF